MVYKEISYREDARIGTITLNRPGQRNSLSMELIKEIHSCLSLAGERMSPRVIVIRGEGPCFCSGHDMTQILDRDITEIRRLFEACIDLMGLIKKIPQPVIAQVHGIATAAGCQLVAACDLAVAAQDSRFATPGVKIGLFCSTPAVALSRNVGKKMALDMLLTGRFVSADEALACGLVNRVVAGKELSAEVLSLAEEIASYSLRTLGPVSYTHLTLPTN